MTWEIGSKEQPTAVKSSHLCHLVHIVSQNHISLLRLSTGSFLYDFSPTLRYSSKYKKKKYWFTLILEQQTWLGSTCIAVHMLSKCICKLIKWPSLMTLALSKLIHMRFPSPNFTITTANLLVEIEYTASIVCPPFRTLAVALWKEMSIMCIQHH